MLDNLTGYEIASNAFIAFVASGVVYLVLVSTFGPAVPVMAMLFSTDPVNIAALFVSLFVFVVALFLLLGMLRGRDLSDLDNLPGVDFD